MLIRLLFFEKTTHFFLPFFLESSNFKPKQTVRRFASSNQCNGPDLLENTIVKLRSVYVR